jgi:quercetin dioxygenase-like cupin family protein
MMAGLLFAGIASAAVPPGTIQMPVGQITWRAAGPNLPAGTQVVVLEGDPKKDGLFTMRLRVPAGTKLAPHWHPRDERVTVLEGTVMVGFGDVADEKSGSRFTAGSFYVNPAGSHHYVWFPETCIIQITAVGPWELHYLKADAAPKP